MSLMKLILNGNFIKNFSILKFTKLNLSTSNTKLMSNNDNEIEQERVLSASEVKLINILKDKFPKANKIIVQDISGGCGSMFDVFVESVEFKDLRLVKRHKLITEALKNEIKSMHGLTIYAATPDEEK